MKYCTGCVAGSCFEHDWITKFKFKTKKEVLLAELNYIIDHNIIGQVVEKVFIAENISSDYSRVVFGNIGGVLNFKINIPTLSMNESRYYMPVSCYSGKDNVINHQVTISVDLMRHNPMKLEVEKSIFDDTVLHSIKLIDFSDNLHMESIVDYPKIIKLAISRLQSYINGESK